MIMMTTTNKNVTARRNVKYVTNSLDERIYKVFDFVYLPIEVVNQKTRKTFM